MPNPILLRLQINNSLDKEEDLDYRHEKNVIDRIYIQILLTHNGYQHHHLVAKTRYLSQA